MINLLPPEIKSRYKVRSKLYSISVAYIIIASIFILGPIALATYNFIQDSQIAGIDSQIEQLKAQIGKSKDINTQLAFVENRTNSAAQYQEQKDWPDYFDHISAALPAPVTLSNIALVSGQKTTFSVAGKSDDRRSIILYRDKLIDDEDIESAEFTNLKETIQQEVKVFDFSINIIFKQ